MTIKNGQIVRAAVDDGTYPISLRDDQRDTVDAFANYLLARIEGKQAESREVEPEVAA